MILKKRTSGADENELIQLHSKEHMIKIITYSTSYGIFVQLDSEDMDEPVGLNVFGLTHFITMSKKCETFGKMFNPIMGAFITLGARLILAITERILMDYGEAYAFCDTDSMAVPIDRVKEIPDYFNDLNSYSFKADIFKLERENYNEETGELEPLWFYGVSAKRYVLYNKKGNEIKIRKFSSHGLGHILNPFTQKGKSEWH